MFRMAFLSIATLLSSLLMAPKGTDDGAWEISAFTIADYDHSNATGVLIMEDNYYSWAVYTLEGNKFIGAGGGTYKKGGNSAEFNVMYHTMDPKLVGKRIMFERKGSNAKWVLKSTQGIHLELKKMKEKTESPLEGTWRITEREQNGTMVEMPEGARKTLKFLSGERFQWAAFNSDTGEFFGTGGGTYTLEDGKYTEHIEFFSRDDSRVGADLTFEYKVTGDSAWHHSGLSSKGAPIYEIWTKQ